jgi:hypothetical protein
MPNFTSFDSYVVHVSKILWHNYTHSMTLIKVETLREVQYIKFQHGKDEEF